MKSLMFLAFTIFTGSQAFIRRKESNPREYNRLDDYKERDASLQKISLVDQPGIGKIMSSWIREMEHKVHQDLKALKDTLPVEDNEISFKVSSAFQELEQKVANDLQTIHNKESAERETFAQALGSDLKFNKTRKKLDHFFQSLRHSVVEGCKELHTKLDVILEELELKAKKIPSWWFQNVRDQIVPVTHQVQEHFRKEVKKARESWKRSSAQFVKEFNKQKEVVNQWFHSLFP